MPACFRRRSLIFYGRLLKRIERPSPERCEGKGLTFRVIQCGAWVRSDAILLDGRILFNLASNAIRYTIARRRGRGLPPPRAACRVEVYDTGPGIPESQRRSIFAEFYRRRKTRARPQGGPGLGLSIVDRLCNLLDHRLTLRSQFDRGSCFSILVPIADAARQAPTLPEVRAFTAVANGRTVIVIDDDALVRDGMGGLLRSWGYRVLTAGTGSAAVARFAKSKEKPDLIISDYHLADGKTGIEVIDGLRRFFADEIPAFLISGDADGERLREARVGRYILLLKPVDPMALRATLAQTLTDQGQPPSPGDRASSLTS